MNRIGIFALIVFAPALTWAAPVMLEGALDLRPSWTASAGTFHTENEVSAHLRFSESTGAGYVQEFQTNLSGASSGLGLQTKDGYFKAEIGLADGWELEPRLYVPTLPTERNAGLILAARPIGKALVDFGSGFGLEVWESPILPWYQTAGVVTEEGATANRAFENRVEIIPTYTVGDDRLTLRIPIVWQWIHYRSFQPGATKDGATESVVWINPELLVAVAPDTGLGLAYYSGDFITAGGLAEGLRTGVTQAVFRQSF